MSLPPQIQGVIFDLDGTLVDTLADLVDAVNAGLQQFGYPGRTIREIRSYIGNGLPTLCRRAMVGRFELTNRDREQLDDESVAAVAATISQYYSEHRLDKSKPYPEIPSLLDGLVARNISLAVLSNKPHAHTVPIVEALLSPWPWVSVEGFRQEAQKKPDPATAQGIVTRMGLTAEQVALVGDSGVDILTARNANLFPVGVTWGYREPQELHEAGAKWVIDSPGQLLD